MITSTTSKLIVTVLFKTKFLFTVFFNTTLFRGLLHILFLYSIYFEYSYSVKYKDIQINIKTKNTIDYNLK